MPSLDKAFSDFLKALRGEQSYASLASKLGIAESTLYRLTNRQQSATLRKIEKILSSQNLSCRCFRRRGPQEEGQARIA
jgi:hypothetical protein